MTQERTVFIADKLSEEALRILQDAKGIRVDYRPELTTEEKVAAIRDATCLIVRSATRVDQKLLEAAQKLELVVRAGVGVDNIDIEAATRRGVVVQNVPEGNVRSAGEHTIALIMALCRNIPEAHRSVKDGLWERSKFTGVEVLGKKLGIVGLGKIGRHVARMASGLGFHVCGFDPFVAPRVAEDLGLELYADLGELVAAVDFLTIHVPKSEATRGLINRQVLSRARRGLRVINCARGGIVDEEALLEGLESGEIAGVAIDVFESEPPGKTPLVLHPKVIATPHLGASTAEAQVNVATAAAQQVVDFLTSRKLHSPVNAVNLAPDLFERVEPYRQLSLRLGRIHSQLLHGNPERIVIKYLGDFFDSEVRSYLTASVLEGFLEKCSAQPINWINARALAEEQGFAVEERTDPSSRYFINVMRVELTDQSGARELGGTIRGRRGNRLVSLDGYQFDAVLEGGLLIVANEDRPGMVAAITKVLAEHQINISYMTLGRDKSGGTAIALLNLDSGLGDSVMNDLRETPGLLWAHFVNVG